MGVNGFPVNAYMDTNLNDVPENILQPIRAELDSGAAWKNVIDKAEEISIHFKMREYEVAQISMAILNPHDTCSSRLLREFGLLGMTLKQLGQWLYLTKKFERCIMDTNIKTYEPLKITKQLISPVDVIERHELKLECSATGFPYPRYTWFLGDDIVEQSSSSGVLYIQRVKKSDAGKYTCRVHNIKLDYLFSRVCEVIIKDNPLPDLDSLTSSPTTTPTFTNTNNLMMYRNNKLTIISHPQEKRVWRQFHEDLRLECEAFGQPPPKYQWYKDNQLLNAQCRSSLYIQKCKMGDSGTYTCIVSNGVHPRLTSRSVEVKIHDCTSSQNLQIVDQPRSQSIEEGGIVTLVCSANGINGQITYRWIRNQHEITGADPNFSIMKGDLCMVNLSTQHSGDYLCIVELHDAQSGQVIATKTSKTATIEVKLSPSHFKKPTAKYALLIGNSNYCKNEFVTLPAVVNDFDRTRAVLESMDFKVFSFIDLTLDETKTAVAMFCLFLMEDCYAFMYFAGHGFADYGNQYLVPCDAPHSPNNEDCVCIDEIHVEVMHYRPAMCVIINDVCHRPFENRNSIIRQQKSHVVPVNGRSYIISTASLGEQSFEQEDGEKRGIFNNYFLQKLTSDTSEVSVNVVFNRILEAFQGEYLVTNGERYPMHPVVKHNLMQHQRSLRDPIDNKKVDVKILDQLADNWRQYCGLPVEPRKIEAAKTNLSLAITYTLRHSNWFSITVRIENLGIFERCSIELHNIPIEVGVNGPVIKARPTREHGSAKRVFIFDVQNVQRLQVALEPELVVTCFRQAPAAPVKFSALLQHTKLRRPLVSNIQTWQKAVQKRSPVEGEDALNSLESEPEVVPNGDSMA